mgnify:CR=1 FL=1
MVTTCHPELDLLAVEVKSGSTVARDFTRNLGRFVEQAGGALDGLPIRPVLVYGGDEAQPGSRVEIVPWRSLPSLRCRALQILTSYYAG